MEMRGWRTWWLVGVVGVFVLAVATLWRVEPRVGWLWLNTAKLAAAVCLISLPVGTLVATLVFKTDVPGRRAAALILVGMLFVPLYLHAGAWDAGFGLQGWHTLVTNPHVAHEPWLAPGWRAAIWVHAMAAVPWVALIVGAGLRAVESEIEEDAATCASPARVLWHVSLRRASGAMAVAALWVAVVVTAEISITDFNQVRTFAEEVYTQAALGTIDFVQPAPADEGGAPLSAIGLWIGLGLSTVVAVVAILAARKLFVDLADPQPRTPWLWRLHALRWPAAIVMWGVVLLVAGVPLGNQLYKVGINVTTAADGGRVRSWSLMKAIEQVAAAPVEFRADLLLSATTGVAAVAAALLVGIPLAWSLRFARGVPVFRLALLGVCLTIPGPLLGIGVIHLLNQSPDSPLAFLGLLYDSYFAPWLVQTVRVLPLVTLVLWPALASVPQAMLDTAATEGSGWWGRLWRIAVPQRWAAVVAAAFVGLAVAVGEVAATVMVRPPLYGGKEWIAVRVFQMLHYGMDDQTAAISLVMVFGIAAMTGIAALLLRRREVGGQRSEVG
jgi:iron(III) transport system permease protein